MNEGARKGYALVDVIDLLLVETVLDTKQDDHELTENHISFRECRILPNGLLICPIDHHQLLLTASRTGIHDDVFDASILAGSRRGAFSFRVL